MGGKPLVGLREPFIGLKHPGLVVLDQPERILFRFDRVFFGQRGVGLKAAAHWASLVGCGFAGWRGFSSHDWVVGTPPDEEVAGLYARWISAVLIELISI